ncbi:hypothetical protein QBC42DRAFT_327536 [Cladorrhinum samala]|uniref:Cell wall mannoprotein PIR1-like C-terminal domain-containing protein n=1 Tax=Cladorrhinum samala TaxID=585594 RepID=A0AAV9HQ13_9PEZI|nr:hypothetical protein QBC42DRAFT_327536 [Cladorrhinum samala]
MFSFALLLLGLQSPLAAAEAHHSSTPCVFHLTGLSTTVNVTVGQLPGGQVQGGNINNTATLFRLEGGGLYDEEGRGCWWADPTTVLVCDIYPPDGPDSLFHMSSDGCLRYNGSSTFYACRAGRHGRVNYYLEQKDPTCRQAFLHADDDDLNSCEQGPIFPPLHPPPLSLSSSPFSSSFTFVESTTVTPTPTTTTTTATFSSSSRLLSLTITKSTTTTTTITITKIPTPSSPCPDGGSITSHRDTLFSDSSPVWTPPPSSVSGPGVYWNTSTTASTSSANQTSIITAAAASLNGTGTGASIPIPSPIPIPAPNLTAVPGGITTHDLGPTTAVIVTCTVWQTVTHTHMHAHTAGGLVTFTTITVTGSETLGSNAR